MHSNRFFTLILLTLLVATTLPATPTTEGDKGPHMDVNGLAWTGDKGPHMDVNGLAWTGDKGPHMDVNGLA